MRQLKWAEVATLLGIKKRIYHWLKTGKCPSDKAEMAMELLEHPNLPAIPTPKKQGQKKNGSTASSQEVPFHEHLVTIVVRVPIDKASLIRAHFAALGLDHQQVG